MKKITTKKHDKISTRKINKIAIRKLDKKETAEFSQGNSG